MVKVRLPCQAGAFYEETTQGLKKQIEECFLNRMGPGRVPEIPKTGLRRIIGLVCPHAGYMFSGSTAAHAYHKLASDGRPDIVVIFGPNHTGHGSALAVVNEGSWQTPLGNVEIDSITSNRIVKESGIVDIDETAHSFEHSIEVQLPFLQFLYGSSFSLVPICFLAQELFSAREVGQAVGRVLSGKNAAVIASSDMTHYESQQRALIHDRLALKAVVAMDETELFSVAESHNMSACGVGPIAAAIAAVKTLGGKEARLLRYSTSGDVTGEYSSVVGYAAMCFTK